MTTVVPPAPDSISTSSISPSMILSPQPRLCELHLLLAGAAPRPAAEADAAVAHRDPQLSGSFLPSTANVIWNSPRLRLAVLEGVDARLDHRQPDLVDLVRTHPHRARPPPSPSRRRSLHLGSHREGHYDLLEHGRFHDGLGRGASAPDDVGRSAGAGSDEVAGPMRERESPQGRASSRSGYRVR